MLRITLFCPLLALTTALSAQVLPVGTVDGSVEDPSHALLAGIKVTLTNLETNQNRTAETNGAGSFFFPLVNPGRYRVSAEKTGFKRGMQEILVETGKRSTADFVLELGQITESVQVTAQAALLETSTAGISRNIQRKVIEDLPLLGRNPLMLVNLSPGITNNSSTNNTTGLIDIDSVSYSSVNGANRRQNEFMLDGIPNNVSDRVAYIPGVDDVEEFTVQTNALDAEYGHGGGMYVNMTTKSGTNQFHGSLYEFFRNDKLNANSFFSNRGGLPRPVFRFNQFGLTAGGPIIKDKVFWFFNWESLRQRTPFTFTNTVPTNVQRQGDFSQTFDRTGALFQIGDALTTHSDGRGGQVRDLFPGNKIPSSRIDPIGAAVVAREPRATSPGAPLTNASNFYSVVPAPYDGDNYSVRVDPNIKRHRLFARWSKNQGFPGTPTPYDIGGGVGALEGNNRSQTSIGVSDAFTISPSMVITAQAGYTRWTQEGIHPTFDPSTLGFSKALTSQMQQAIFPRFNNSDILSIGASEGQWFEHTNTYSYNIGSTKVASSHNMKWGIQGQVKQNNSVPANAPAGLYAFDRGFTQPNPFGPGLNLGNGIASLLLGYPASSSVDIRAFNAAQAPYYGFYFQDDYKVSQKLTLNLGLRYELLLGTTERFDRNVLGFDQNLSNPIEAQAKANYAGSPIPELPAANFSAKGGLFFATPQDRRNQVADKKAFAPRIGLAYRILPRTVIRTGFGVFYSQWWQPFVKQTGFSSNTAMVTTLDGGLTPADTLKNPYPLGLIQPTGASLGLQTLLGQALSGIYDYDRLTQRNFRWSFGIQQELKKDFTFELNYIGQLGTRLPLSTGGNGSDNDLLINSLDQKYFGLGTRLNARVANPFKGLIPAPSVLSGDTITISQLLSPYPEFGAVSLQRVTKGESYYHSLQASVNRRFSAGLTLQFAYTWSKQLERLRLIEPSDPEPSKMIGEFDNPHRVALAAIYELPFGQGKSLRTHVAAIDKIIGGWQWSAMYIYQTGQAAPLVAAVATGISPKIDHKTIDRWFNLDSMKVLPAFTARRNPWQWNDIRQASINNWDMSIMKNTFVYRERVKLQLRCELINALNRTWFGQSNVNPANANYGRVTGQSNNPRNIQLGAKLTF